MPHQYVGEKVEVHTAIGQDGDNMWPRRKELMAETIRASVPDVLGCQEALAEQINFPSQNCPSTYEWASTAV